MLTSWPDTLAVSVTTTDLFPERVRSAFIDDLFASDFSCYCSGNSN